MKGILKSFESIVAILMVLTVFLVLFAGERIPDVEAVTWRLRGFEALKALDKSNRLATPALADNTSSIETELASILPIGVNYDVVVCTQTCPTFSTSSEKITSVSYFIAGNAINVEPREVVLYLWRETP
jgi:hypothetical protein